MKICYVANFEAGGNDDENAVLHAMRELGHEVLPIREEKGRYACRAGADLCLFHKFHDVATLEYLRGRACRAFWYWDRVEDPDPLLARRNAARTRWMAEVLPHVELGFCTDGDWVARDTTGKLVWLPQGADGRVVGRGKGTPPEKPRVLFTGLARKCGSGRESFVAEMKARWGESFVHVERGVHGRALADLVTSCQVVVAPDAPASDKYWSNRVYNTLGFGGFLLHPWCYGLTEHYRSSEELIFYHDRTHLYTLIALALGRPDDRQRIASAGLARTRHEHLYRHRVEQLLRTVKERGHA